MYEDTSGLFTIKDKAAAPTPPAPHPAPPAAPQKVWVTLRAWLLGRGGGGGGNLEQAWHRGDALSFRAVTSILSEQQLHKMTNPRKVFYPADRPVRWIKLIIRALNNRAQEGKVK